MRSANWFVGISAAWMQVLLLALATQACGRKETGDSKDVAVEPTRRALSTESTPFIRYDITATPATPNPTAVDAYLTQSGDQFWTLQLKNLAAPTGHLVGTGADAAWEVNSLGGIGREEFWSVPVTAHDVALGRARGWTLRTRFRLPTPSDALGHGVAASYFDGLRVWTLMFGTDASGNALVQVRGDTSPPIMVAGTTFHVYELTYDPAVGTAHLRVDGQVVRSGLVGDTTASAAPGVQFGDLAQSDEGHGQYQSMEWRIHQEEFPPTTLPNIPRGTPRVRYEITTDTATHDPTQVDAHLIEAGQQPWVRQTLGIPSAIALVDGGRAALDINGFVGGPGKEDKFRCALSPVEVTAGQDRGWSLKMRGRLIRYGDTVGPGAAAQFFTGQRVWELRFGTDSAGRPIVGTSGDGQTFTLNEAGDHTYELVYRPDTGRATLVVDNVERLFNIPGQPYTSTVFGPHILFGDLAQSDDGHGQFQLVEWSVVDPPSGSNLVTIVPGEDPLLKYKGQICILGQNCVSGGNAREFALADGTYQLYSPYSSDLAGTSDRLGTITISQQGTRVILSDPAKLYFYEPPQDSPSHTTTLTARTLTIRLDRSLYKGELNCYVACAFDVTATSQAKVIPSRTYSLYSNFAYLLPGETDHRLYFNVSLGGDVTVTHVPSRRSIREGTGADSSMIIPQVAPVTLVRSGWNEQYFALYGIEAFSATLNESTVYALRAHRYNFYAQASCRPSDCGVAFSSGGFDLTVDEQGGLALNPELVSRPNFTITQEGKLQAITTPVTLDKSGFKGLLAPWYLPDLGTDDVVVLQLMRGRRYAGIWPRYSLPITPAPANTPMPDYLRFTVENDGCSHARGEHCRLFRSRSRRHTSPLNPQSPRHVDHIPAQRLSRTAAPLRRCLLAGGGPASAARPTLSPANRLLI